MKNIIKAAQDFTQDLILILTTNTYVKKIQSFLRESLGYTEDSLKNY